MIVQEHPLITCPVQQIALHRGAKPMALVRNESHGHAVLMVAENPKADVGTVDIFMYRSGEHIPDFHNDGHMYLGSIVLNGEYRHVFLYER